ncbi:MAG: FAD-dependent oxidoreductase [Hyphomicrobiaceae bacterium]|nr:MAG: FAD-dependent oxidoreductase [Hyphomicrobiaceae bacterium]
MSLLPSQARVVVIGGGAVGCSALYHLASRGLTDALLLEMDELTSGSTWHAAGNCPNFSGSFGIMKLQRYSTKLYAGLGAAVDYPIDYHVTGAIRLAQSRERMDEFRHVTGMARHQGIEFEMLSTGDIKDRYPFIETKGLMGGQWDPLDGDIDPAQLTQALAKGARDKGARIVRNCRVTGFSRTPAGEWRIETAAGAVSCETVVNAAGYRAAEVGRLYGRDIPCVAMSHQYLVTGTIGELSTRKQKLPLLRDPDDSYYLRQERDGLLLGPYEWQATPHWTNGEGVPASFAFQLFADDLDRLEEHIAKACGRVPILGSAGIKKVINGPIPYTPDGNPLVGPAPGVPNVFEACVFSFGIVQAGGAGKLLADWVIEGETEWDLWSFDPRRFTGHVNEPYTRAKAVELYQNEYAIGFPFEERPAGRPAKTSPLYPVLKAKGALFGARNGWERAVWFPRDGEEAKAQSALTLRRPAFHEAIGRECHAIAETVGVVELPGFSRFEVSGRRAAEALDAMIAGALPRVGRLALSYVLTPKGGVLSEFTVTRLADDRFWLLGASSAEWHDRDLLERHAGGKARIDNLTAMYSTLVVTGPRSRELLSRVTPADLSTAAFPWLSWRSIRLGVFEVVAMRVSYAGELGFELHVPMEELVPVYDLVMEAGRDLGAADVGIYALDSLRLEKCYRSWKQDLTTEYSAFACGLDRFVRLDKPSFPGREALLREQSAGGPKDRLVPLIVDCKFADAPATATVFQGKERVGLVMSGGYGHRLKASIALAYVQADLARRGQPLWVDVFGESCPAVVGTEPLFDPSNERLRG